MGIRVVEMPTSEDFPSRKIGQAPGCAEALWHYGHPAVFKWEGFDGTWADALHEALHLCLGVCSLTSEFGMMAVEWAIAQELAPEWFALWRDDFRHYGLGADGLEIGRDDEFRFSPEWAADVAESHARGWLHDGRPIWGMAVHPSIVALASEVRP